MSFKAYLYKSYRFKTKKPIWTDADSALKNIHKGKRILIGSGCAAPQHLIGTLIKNASSFRDNEICHILTTGPAPYTDPQYSQNFRHGAFFIGHNVRSAVQEGKADYIPIFLSEVPRLFLNKQMPLHACLIQVAPPDKDGFVSLGVSVDVLPAAILTADIVIAQVNNNMPYTLGAARIPLKCLDYLVKMDEPLQEFPQGDPDEVSMKIAKNLARFMRDGDTLQMGIGNIPDAVLKNLTDKNDLGVHSEMISDGILELYKRGNITNKYKGINKNKSLVSFVLGTSKLYQVIHQNDDFQFFPTEYINDPFIICQNDNMVSINSAIQIDLTGQVCSDSIGTSFYSGFGGQVDFVRGAKRSKGGRTFIALPSTAKEDSLSRIVPMLLSGSGVVTTRADVQNVVTEYGVAYLHGKSVRERAMALIQIAHPKFRDELLDYLKQKHYVYVDSKLIKDDHSTVKELIPYSHTFKDKTIYFRPLRPTDEKAIQDFFYSHRPETIYQRYLTYIDSMPREVAQARVAVDYNKDMAIAGFDSWMPYAQMVCLGRYIRKEDNTAEMGFVVKENYQGLGIGTFMCKCLIIAAKQHGVIRLFAYVSKNNMPMLKIFKNNEFNVRESKKIDGYFFYRDIEKEKEKEV